MKDFANCFPLPFRDAVLEPSVASYKTIYDPHVCSNYYYVGHKSKWSPGLETSCGSMEVHYKYLNRFLVCCFFSATTTRMGNSGQGSMNMTFLLPFVVLFGIYEVKEKRLEKKLCLPIS